MGKAIFHVIFRSGLIFVLGLIVLLADGSSLISEKNGMQVVGWDVIPTLGFVGFVTLPFIILIKKPEMRIIVAYAWMVLYQILMLTAGLKAYAQSSVHGGIFGTIFGYAGIMIVASALGDYLFYSKTEDAKKYRNLALFGAFNLIAGLAISFIPGWEAAKRQVSLTHCMISIGITVLGLCIFAYVDLVHNKEMNYLQAFGRNPFLTYLLAELPIFILKSTVGEDLGLGPIGNIILAIILVTYTSLLMVYLYKRKKIISTEKIALIFILIGIPLAIILVVFKIL
jgi:hypothetical protein